jgi:hypothetical protein
MKAYESIINSNQVNIGTMLFDMDYNNDVWHTYKVTDVKDHGIELKCPSGAYIFVSNEKLALAKEYFKRVN